MESHVAFFDFAGGIFKQMVYDNMRVAVAKFVGTHEKNPPKPYFNYGDITYFPIAFVMLTEGMKKGMLNVVLNM